MTACMEEGWHNPSSVYGPAVAAFRQVRACREAILEKLGAPGEKTLLHLRRHGGQQPRHPRRGGAHCAANSSWPSTPRSTPRCWPPSSACAQWATRCACFPWTKRARSTMKRWKKPERRRQPCKLHAGQQRNRRAFGGAAPEKYRRRPRPHSRGRRAGFLRVPFHFADVDMYTISAHKLHGPKGVGALAVKKGVRLNPQHIGGGQEEDLRSGTEKHPRHRRLLRGRPGDGRLRPDGEKAPHGQGLHGRRARGRDQRPRPGKGRAAILNISFPGVRGETMLHALEAEGVYASTGSAARQKSARSQVCSRPWASPWIAPRAPCASAFRRIPPLRKSTTPPKCFAASGRN